jgi:uncharacterized protein YfaP (DUF2135 family)
MQHDSQKGIQYCKSLLNLINTQNTKNLISGQEEEVEKAQKETSCYPNGEATRGKHSSTKRGPRPLFFFKSEFTIQVLTLDSSHYSFHNYDWFSS